MLKFAELVKLKDNDLVMTYKGTTPEGENFFAYILCNQNQVSLMRGDFQNKISRPLTEYGEVIYFDYLPEPDEIATEFLANWTAENSGSLI